MLENNVSTQYPSKVNIGTKFDNYFDKAALVKTVLIRKVAAELSYFILKRLERL